MQYTGLLITKKDRSQWVRKGITFGGFGGVACGSRGAQESGFVRVSKAKSMQGFFSSPVLRRNSLSVIHD
jgi:hypothetical protein